MSTSLSELLRNSLDCTLIRYVNLLIITQYNLINLLQDKECFINSLCKRSVVLLLLAYKFPKIRNNLLFTYESLPKNNMTTFLDNLRSSNPENLNMLTIKLSKMLLLELISREKDCKPFWTPVYKALSEKLWLPTEIDLRDSDLNSLSTSLTTQVVNSQLLTIRKIKVQKMNYPRTLCPSFTSTAVNKWEKESIPPTMKAIKIKLKINQEKKNLFNQWFKSSNFSYNKAVSAIRNGHAINEFSLRDKFVTANTKKTNPEYQRMETQIKTLRQEKKQTKDTSIDEKIKVIQLELKEKKKEMKSTKNEGVYEWELETPKAVRSESIRDVCKAYKTLFTMLKQGNIRRFQVGFRRKTNPNQCMGIPKSMIENKNGHLIIGPSYFDTVDKAKISMGKKTMKRYKNIEINHDCRMVKKHNEYWLFVPVQIEPCTEKRAWSSYSGVDPGIRTFMTSFGTNGCNEYEHNESKIKNVDTKIKRMKVCKKYVRKQSLWKQEQRKEHYIDEIHWKTIKSLLSCNDVLFYGDIKSHNIVRGNKNRTLNRDTNNLKFYKFKERLLFKASEQRKIVICTKEHYTTKTCSFCGTMNEPGISKLYYCSSCKKRVGRDVNAAKNILMKGLVKHV